MKILGGRIIIFVALVISSFLFGDSSAMNAALNAAAASLTQRLSDLSGRRVDARNFGDVGRLRGNARPRQYSLRERITEEMFRMLCAYVFAVLFTRTQMHCQIYCSFWVYPPWLSSLLVIVRFYGWAIASLLINGGGGYNDGGRGYFRNTRLTGAQGAPFANNLLEKVALKSLAVFLSCRVRDLPPGLRQIPHSSDLYSLAFIALVDYMPLLEIVVCCHNRCKSACRRRDLSPRQTDGICKAYIYASDSVSSNVLLDGVRRHDAPPARGAVAAASRRPGPSVLAGRFPWSAPPTFWSWIPCLLSDTSSTPTCRTGTCYTSLRSSSEAEFYVLWCGTTKKGCIETTGPCL